MSEQYRLAEKFGIIKPTPMPMSEGERKRLKNTVRQIQFQAHLKERLALQGESLKPRRRIKMALKSRRGTYDDDPIEANPSQLNLDPEAHPRGYATFDAKSGFIIKIRQPAEHALDKKSKISGKFESAQGPTGPIPWLRYGKDQAPGSDRVPYADAPWYKRGIGPMGDEGSHVRKVSKQRGDKRNYDKATTRFND